MSSNKFFFAIPDSPKGSNTNWPGFHALREDADIERTYVDMHIIGFSRVSRPSLSNPSNPMEIKKSIPLPNIGNNML